MPIAHKGLTQPGQFVIITNPGISLFSAGIRQVLEKHQLTPESFACDLLSSREDPSQTELARRVAKEIIALAEAEGRPEGSMARFELGRVVSEDADGKVQFNIINLDGHWPSTCGVGLVRAGEVRIG